MERPWRALARRLGRRASRAFPPVAAQPDLAAQEHRILEFWRERATFARLRAQNAGGPTWSFLDGPITANNPMGVHHAWGRTYKDLYQRFHAMLGEDQRWQNGFDCQGLWVEVNVERELGFTSKKDIEAYGIAEFVRLCKQRVLTYAAQSRPSSPSASATGWTGTTPTSCAGCATCWRGPLAGHHGRGPARARDRHGRDDRRPPGPARAGRLVLHVLATRTTTSSGASSRSATGAAGSTRASTPCPGARAAARA